MEIVRICVWITVLHYGEQHKINPYIYVCVHTLKLCTHLHKYIHTYIHKSHIYAHKYTYAKIHICTYTHTYGHIILYTHMHAHTNTSTGTYTHIQHTHIHKRFRKICKRQIAFGTFKKGDDAREKRMLLNLFCRCLYPRIF